MYIHVHVYLLSINSSIVEYYTFRLGNYSNQLYNAIHLHQYLLHYTYAFYNVCCIYISDALIIGSVISIGHYQLSVISERCN